MSWTKHWQWNKKVDLDHTRQVNITNNKKCQTTHIPQPLQSQLKSTYKSFPSTLSIWLNWPSIQLFLMVWHVHGFFFKVIASLDEKVVQLCTHKENLSSFLRCQLQEATSFVKASVIMFMNESNQMHKISQLKIFQSL